MDDGRMSMDTWLQKDHVFSVFVGQQNDEFLGVLMGQSVRLTHRILSRKKEHTKYV